MLRFWETEFPQLAPIRTDKGQRLYSEENLALLRRIKHLLHEQGLTIEGARRVLASGQKTGEAAAAAPESFLGSPALQSQLPSGAELGYIKAQLVGLPENGPAAPAGTVADPASGFAPGRASNSVSNSDEFWGIDPTVLEEVIDSLEEVRRMLLPR